MARVGELRDDGSGFICKPLSTFLNPFDTTIFFEQVQNKGERDLIIGAVRQNRFNHGALGEGGALKRVDEGEGDLALPEVAADGFAEGLFAGGEVQDVVDKLE